MLFSFFIFSLFVWTLPAFGKEATLENDFVAFTFDSTKGLTQLVDKKSGINSVGNSAGAVANWEFQLVDKIGILAVDQLQDADFSFSRTDKSNSLTVRWDNIDVKRDQNIVTNINVTLGVFLSGNSTISEWEFAVAINRGDPVGVWEGVISLPLSIASDQTGELFFPNGFGHTFDNPKESTGGNMASTYPGGYCTMQFMGMGNSKSPTGVYMSALDGTGQAKGLQYSTYESSVNPTDAHVIRGGKGKKVKAPVRKWRSAARDGAAAISMTIFPTNAGVVIENGATWTAPYRLAVGVLQDVSSEMGRPLWSEAAQVYRQWALDNADWMKHGTLAQRMMNSKKATDEKRIRNDDFASATVPPMPTWYRSNALWLNTHWQCHDIFNTTGGDPHFVLPYTIEVADRIWGPRPDSDADSTHLRSMALHWYEWQQGPDPAPEARYLFDTHYPDYFPSRTDFKSAVKELRAHGIQSFPYINGRISDVNSISYAQDNGELYCSKAAPARLVDPGNPQGLTSYVETYGSNATFCVTNPFTAYWQQKLAETVEQLVDDYGCPGVYIDQVGSAIPKLCWDSSHGHTMGGGNFWATGYQAMMDAISQSLYSPQRTPTAQEGYPMVTEDNAEPYMGMVQGMLTLNAFKASLAQAPSASLPSTSRMNPAYPMIYGGYYTGFGAIWTRADFADHDWWCSKLSAMLVTGSQLGWFSLAGVADDAEDSCGPMGVGDLFMSSSSDDLVSFLQLLTRTRHVALDYLSDGALLRSPRLMPPAPVRVFTSSFDGEQVSYDTVLVQAWRLPQDTDGRSSVMVFVVNAMQEEEYCGSVEVRPENWNLPSGVIPEGSVLQRDMLSASAVSVEHQLHSTSFQEVQIMGSKAGVVRIDVTVAARSVKLLKFAV